MEDDNINSTNVMLRCCHRDTAIVRVHLVHRINAEQHRANADIWTKPISLSHVSAYSVYHHSRNAS